MPIPEERLTELPIACSLPPGEQVPRVDRWRALAARYLLDEEATAEGVRLRYRLEPEAVSELEDLARLERDCCGWADWRVERTDDAVVLEVTAEGDGAAAVRSMFGLDSAEAPGSMTRGS